MINSSFETLSSQMPKLKMKISKHLDDFVWILVKCTQNPQIARLQLKSKRKVKSFKNILVLFTGFRYLKKPDTFFEKFSLKKMKIFPIYKNTEYDYVKPIVHPLHSLSPCNCDHGIITDVRVYSQRSVTVLSDLLQPNQPYDHAST